MSNASFGATRPGSIRTWTSTRATSTAGRSRAWPMAPACPRRRWPRPPSTPPRPPPPTPTPAAALPAPAAPPFGFIGPPLSGEARPAFARSLGHREGLRYRMVEAVRAHPALVSFIAAGLLSAAFTGVILGLGSGLPSALAVGMALVALIPVSQLALKVTDYLVTRVLPPRTLPKMDFSETGI